MGIRDRLKRLESGHIPPCDGCGDESNVRYEVTWDHDPGDPDEPERCVECGRLLTIVVTWDGLDALEDRLRR